jgi:hypothetical protein
MNDNYGIVGNVDAENVAVGTNASIRVDGTGTPDVTRALEALLAAIEAHDAPSDVRETLVANVGEVQEELARTAPDPKTLQNRLKTIVTLTGAASGVAVAADDLLALVRHRF